MAIKNLGHYEGVVDDINTTSLQFRLLHPHHKELILLNREKQNLTSRINSIDQRISAIKSEIKAEVKIGNIPWAWVWYKKSGRVKWKEEFVRACGQSKAQQIANTYEVKEYMQIGVKYVDPCPDSIKQIKQNPSKFPLIKHRLSTKKNL